MATPAKARIEVKSTARSVIAMGKAMKRNAKKKAMAKYVPLSKAFVSRDEQVRRGEYEMIGQVQLLRTERGDIDFRTDGPFLAQLDSDRSLVLMNEWKGFPSLYSIAPGLCPDCKAKCLSCDGHGERLCMGMNCGGYGKMILSYEPCPEIGCYKDTGKVNSKCSSCEGAGRIVGQTAPCPACEGTKKQKCPLCDGTGKMSTGRKAGALRDSQEPACESCRGTGRKLKEEAQDYKEFELGVLEGFTALGPIHEVLLRADVCRDAARSLELGKVYPDAAWSKDLDAA